MRVYENYCTEKKRELKTDPPTKKKNKDTQHWKKATFLGIEMEKKKEEKRQRRKKQSIREEEVTFP